jgi:benzaldehyde dehydrogenase (NAD)
MTSLSPHGFSKPLYNLQAPRGDLSTASHGTDVREPATGAVLGRIGVVSPEEVRVASAAARLAQPGWAAKAAEERTPVLRNAAILGDQHREAIIAWLIRESGSIRGKAAFELDVTIRAF